MIKKRLLNKNGFSLGELLIAILILLLVTGIVAGGVPAAIRVYNKVTETANAQAYLTTTTTSLRDMLDTAKDVSVDTANKTITFIGQDGMKYVLTLSDTGMTYVIKNPFDVGTPSDPYNLVSLKTGTEKEFYAVCDSVSYDDNIVSFGKIKVKNSEGKIVTSEVDYKVKILNVY